MVRLLVDNHVHAAALLREQHYQVDERDVIYTVTSNDPGALARIARLLADAGVNVEYMYATAIEGSPMAASSWACRTRSGPRRRPGSNHRPSELERGLRLPSCGGARAARLDAPVIPCPVPASVRAQQSPQAQPPSPGREG